MPKQQLHSLQQSTVPTSGNKSFIVCPLSLRIYDEALSDGTECFVTGTAAGVSYLESLTHGDKTTVFNKGKIGNLTMTLLKTLKGIQYSALPDKFGWMLGI